MLHPSLVPLALSSDSVRKVGAKAARLARVAREGIAVPATWVLDAEPFRDLVETTLPAGHDPWSLLRVGRERARVERAARARAATLAATVPGDLATALHAVFDELGPVAPWGLVVRASPTTDDESTAGAAGLGGAIFGVTTKEALVDAVRATWASLFLPRALAHLVSREVRDVAMAVVVQPVLVADASGVVATRPPASPTSTSWRTGERLVNAWLGLGAPVIDGDVDVDVLRVAEGGDVVGSSIAHKRAKLAVRGGALESVAIDVETPVLGPERVARVASLARELERRVGPCHVSFAFVGHELVATEVRSDTESYAREGAAETIWTRTNIGESFPSIVTPFTWSLTEELGDASFRRALARLGCDVPREARFVGNVRGRAYLDLTTLVRAAVQIPGLDPAAIVELAGTSGVETLDREAERVSRRRFYARLPVTAARLVAEQTRIAAEVSGFESFVEDARRGLDELDLAILPDDALPAALRDVRTILSRAATMLTSATTSYVASHLALRSLLARSFPVLSAHLAQVLTAGVQDLAATRVATAFASAARLLRDDRDASEALRAASEGRGELPSRAVPIVERLLRDEGDHAVRESDFAIPRWREDPRPVYGILSALLAEGVRDAERALAQVRVQADRELATLDGRIPLLELGLVRALVERTKKLSELRERVRAWMTRVLAMVRGVAVEADRRIRRVDPSLPHGAVFFCTPDELVAALGTGRPDVGNVVRMRLAEHARDTARPDPPISFVGAPPALVMPPPGEAVLRGVSAGGGVATGPARVVRGDVVPWSIRPGEILVAKSVDVALSPLFVVASAVVTELGGPLTHAAGAARELGTPMVVHVAGATRAIRDGDQLRVDGNAGVVERIGR